MSESIQKLFKPYIVNRKNGQCQVLIPLIELDDLCDKIITLLHGEGKEEPQPDPWEAWVGEMPNPSLGTGINWTDWADRMKDWFRKMPRGK